MWEWAKENPGYFTILIMFALLIFGIVFEIAFKAMGGNYRHKPCEPCECEPCEEADEDE